MRILRPLLLATSFVVSTSVAYASPLTISNVTGDWQSAVYPGPQTPTIVHAAGQGTDTVRWGQAASSAGQSGYDFTPLLGSVTPALGVAFSLGTFTHHNNPVGLDGSVITAIDYAFGFDTNGVPAALADIFHFQHDETPNAPPCPPGSVSVCDDVVTLSSVNLNSLITVGGETYYFNLLGFSTDGGATIKSQFLSPEGSSNSAQLYGEVTDVPVPEPTSLLLVGTGIIGAARRYRRRSRE